MNLNNQTLFSEELMPTALCDFDAVPEIRAAALRVASGVSDPAQITQRICNFIKRMPYRYDDWDVKASNTLKRGWGMCSGKANLLVATLRSLQIPARYVIAKCHAELELFNWLVIQDPELARILGEPYMEIDHVNAEVYLDNRWQLIDAARDPALEAGLIFLGIPVEMRVIDRFSRSSFDDWAITRQKAVRLKSVRPAMLKLMNEQLDRIRAAPGELSIVHIVNNINLRKAVEADSEFAYQTKKSAFKQYVDQVSGWNEEEQRRLHDRRFSSQDFQVIQVSGVDAGILAVVKQLDCVKVNQLFILPEFQSRGVGAACIHHIIKEAAGAGLPVRLQVLKVNPRALEFYRRLGFSRYGDSETHVLLEKLP